MKLAYRMCTYRHNTTQHTQTQQTHTNTNTHMLRDKQSFFCDSWSQDKFNFEPCKKHQWNTGIQFKQLQSSAVLLVRNASIAVVWYNTFWSCLFREEQWMLLYNVYQYV